MEASEACYALIRRFEGLRLTAYLCPAGRWTIGYGHTDGVTRDMEVNAEDAETLLEHDVWVATRGLLRLTDGLELTQGQWDALVSLTFNVGTAAIAASHLVMYLKAGALKAASEEFSRWNHVHGVVSAGLTIRRLAEQAMFLAKDERPAA